MKRLTALALIPMLAGCLTATPPEIATWTIDFVSQPAAGDRLTAEEPTRGNVRVAQVVVRAPYDVRTIAVLRPNGSLAFDVYNQFAALPSALIKNAVQDALSASGAFRSVAAPASQLKTDLSAETTVTKIALDCREDGSRRAVISVKVLLLREREVFAASAGEGSADAADGNYSKAFSAAFSAAFSEALKKL